MYLVHLSSMRVIRKLLTCLINNKDVIKEKLCGIYLKINVFKANIGKIIM